jgi:hypothetical protein
MEDLLNQILAVLRGPELQSALANALLAIITIVVGFVSKNGYTWLRANTTAKQQSILEQVATTAVLAAEQGRVGGFVTEKKQTALSIIQDALDKAGISLTATQISAAIEAAVLREFNTDKVVAQTTGTTEASASGSLSTPSVEALPAPDAG